MKSWGAGRQRRSPSLKAVRAKHTAVTADTITHGNTRHGQSRSVATDKATPTYRTWVSMLARCNNPKASNYSKYGGRGIRVCKRWQTFEGFLADVGERPEGTTLDRFPDTNGNYEPGNVRWATASEQASNRRPTSEWVEEPGRVNRSKTHCKRGHELSGDNLRVTADGRRRCRACASMHDKAAKAARRSK